MDRFFLVLERHRQFKNTCIFIVMPDVVGDARATHCLYFKWRYAFSSTGFPVAYVLQDGQESVPVPNDVDCWFLGGSDKFKLSKQAHQMLLDGKRKGKWIHVGRVNSLKRVLRFDGVADSVDGNHHKFEPSKALHRIIYWMKVANQLHPKQRHMAWKLLHT